MSSDTESTVCDPRLEVAPEPQVPKGPGQIRRATGAVKNGDVSLADSTVNSIGVTCGGGGAPVWCAEPPQPLTELCVSEDPIKASGSTSNVTDCTTATAHSKSEADETDTKADCTTATAHSKIETGIGKTYPPTSTLNIGAYAELLAPFDETSGATKIGDPSLEESFTNATAPSENDAASLLFLHPCAAVLALLLAEFLEPLLRGQVKKKRGVCGTPAAPPSAPPISPPPSPPSPPKVLVQFAVTSGSRCAESLPYGPEPSNFATSTSPLVCTDCVTDTTDTWEQEFYCDGSTGPDLTLEYKFDTDRTIGATLAAANLGGIPVTWSASGSLLSSPVTMSGTWVGTSTTVYWTGSVGASGSALASDDFAWMGGGGVIIDGDQQNTVSGSTGVCSGTGVYGQSNCNSGDSSCSTLYYGSSSKSCSSMITRDGGVVYASSSGAVSIINSDVRDCSADNNGGVVYARDSGAVSITGSAVTSCSAGIYGSGGVVYAKRNSGAVSMIGSTMTSCSAGEDGGVVSAYKNSGAVSIIGSTVSGCSADGDGGVVFAEDSGAVSIIGSTMTSCSAYYGGVVSARDSGAVSLSGSTVSGCSAGGNGGVVYARDSGAPVSIIVSNVSDCSAGSNGGVVYAWDSGAVSLSGSNVSGCSAGSYGGVVYAWYSISLSIAGIAFIDNRADGSGSVLYLSNTPSSISDASFTGNTAGDDTTIQTNSPIDWDCRLGSWMPRKGTFFGDFS
ncbi:hypothetical protein EMIHUDRAFT_239306, partial [Emiliania huxleyi CCMP1516]|uniref:Right handed beta helix domain-containing protein n=2 Tax=Emiliania huxleyi TaxID=2903 RepID=A0A0D3JJI3_EMIH1